MKIPFCDFCVKSGSLCKKCRELIESGRNDALDLSISKILLEEASKIHELDKVELRKAYKEGNFLLILSNNEGIRAIRNREELVKKIMNETNSERVILVDYRKDQKRKLEELVHPFRIVGLSKIWLPGNMTEFKLILEGRKLKEEYLQLLEKLAKRLDINVRIRFS
ncbi:MAG: hypothetical protein ACUVQY_08505 [Thermoproteota archaeon]